MTEADKEKVRRWLGVAVPLAIWLASAIWFSSAYATRLNMVEKAIEQKASQEQLQDVKDRLTRIEDKLDKALERGK